MANIKSQIKRNKQNETTNSANRQKISKLRTLIKKYKASVDTANPNATELKNEVISYIDNCASKGLIKQNNAARKKSQIMTYQAKSSQ
ncbi:hypothetical protein ASO20_02810 [Mycoplasma sp. (ex Biomphalaria glabrata)]|uniref:30S ribosomal protein S20 n=1 Tax=Mycoplasma sp. (ex Biomphalaria glabrata) TaxID=1749074 RepID=UPI00073A5C25|nr:30S ribosomal protein S20 [Mycoplasma sp. (ex Biomphalaria glabrata)]ALV23564.1 hypothetical protein ASO20_02810 [Mycoplasma sp. (ex Biomphalaria glabrata)]